jgi:hypothetical protein
VVRKTGYGSQSERGFGLNPMIQRLVIMEYYPEIPRKEMVNTLM